MDGCFLILAIMDDRTPINSAVMDGCFLILAIKDDRTSYAFRCLPRYGANSARILTMSAS